MLCRGARAAKGGGLKILWRRPSWVRIPSPALKASKFKNFDALKNEAKKNTVHTDTVKSSI